MVFVEFCSFYQFLSIFSRTLEHKTEHLNISVIIIMDIGIQKCIPRYIQSGNLVHSTHP